MCTFSSSLCTESALERHVKSICLKISKDIPDHYDDNIIITKSECKNEISIDFEIVKGGAVSLRSKRTVGMCYMNTSVTKCITKGSEENSVLVYSYIRNACLQPEPIDYDFSTTPSTEIDFPGMSIYSTPSDKEKGDIATPKTAQHESSSNSGNSMELKKKRRHQVLKNGTFKIIRSFDLYDQRKTRTTQFGVELVEQLVSQMII